MMEPEQKSLTKFKQIYCPWPSETYNNRQRMNKEFVSLNSPRTSSKNPYEVCTFFTKPQKSQESEFRVENCSYERKCNMPKDSIKAKVLTIEDEIRKIHKKVQENIFAKRRRNKCKKYDQFHACVTPQRTRQDLKRHAVLRENFLKVKHEGERYVHDMAEIYSNQPDLVQLENPPQISEVEKEDDDAGGVWPEAATPECSMEMIYIPSSRILELQRPKSGVYLNEKNATKFNTNDVIPYSSYNPRVLQEQFDAQNLKKVDIISGKTPSDLWTWNLGLQQSSSKLDSRYTEAAVLPFNSENVQLSLYKIPQDLEKTFSAVIVFGNKCIEFERESKRKQSFKRPREIACLYIAYVDGFRLNVEFWNSETLDNILKMGDKLITKSNKMNYLAKNNNYDIIPQIVERQAEVSLKLHYSGTLKGEPNIYKALSRFFSKHNACVFCSKHLYLLILKRCKNLFYIYDPNGRGENCERDFVQGKSALISTHYVEHLVHLIVNISQTKPEDEYNLYEIYLLSFGKILRPLPKKGFPKKFHKMWTVVDDTFALIPGCNNGLFQPNSATVHNPSMLISIMAILYGHIERANVWKPETMDDLIRLGTAYYKSLRRKLKLKDTQHINIGDLPEKYVLGTFKASLKKEALFYAGTISDYCKKFSDSLLACGIRQLFEGKWQAALLQIDNSVVALWKDVDLFYLYDPFRRGKAGQVLDPDDYRTKGCPVLQMHTNLESLLCVLYQKALKIRRGGKFFIHAISVGCIKPIMDGKPRKLRYPKLKLTPETYGSYNEKKDATAGGDNVDMEQELADELQLATEKIVKRSKKKNDKKEMKTLEKVCSIESLKPEEQVVIYDKVYVVESLLDVVINDIINTFPEPVMARPKPYKAATKVLLKSDKEYLEHLQYMLQHDQDYDNEDNTFPKKPDTASNSVTLEEELAKPSNFQNLPDGAWIIFGSQILPHVNDEQTKLKGLLAAIVTSSLMAHYKISTWNNTLVDYAINATESFGEDFQIYQTVVALLLAQKLPTLSLGEKMYATQIQKVIKSDLQKPLQLVLNDSLRDYPRLLVVCQRFSCLIVKRFNLLYMFNGFPVNAVGYRECTTGPACLLRSIELDNLIRRIEFASNPRGCDITNYIVLALKVKDITSETETRYRQWPAIMENRMYQAELKEEELRQENEKAKLEFLEKELREETQRIQKFRQAKEVVKNKRQAEESKMTAAEVSESDKTLGNDDIETQQIGAQSKHKIGAQLTTSPNECWQPRPMLYGYRMREKDNLYKIQGSKALSGREICEIDKIKTCFFASTLAILSAILKPHNQWTAQRIDQVINTALSLNDIIKDLKASDERSLKNVNIDDYTFDVCIRGLETLGLMTDLAKYVEKISDTKKYFLLHTANCTYAIYRDQYYHLFDAYPSMEVLDNMPKNTENQQKVVEQQSRKNSKYLKGIQRYGERNTASWILFADAKSMLHYMDERCCSPQWKENLEYTFQVVDIISYKKLPKSAYALQLLTDMDQCNASDNAEIAICTENETTDWLENCLPIWSRRHRRNSAGFYRGLAVSKLKEFDVEISERLWSLWGNLHPQAPVFEQSTRGKQYLACCVMALCAARLYRIMDWSSQLLDAIIINGDRYHRQSIQNIKARNYEMMLKDLDEECQLDNVQFRVHVEPMCFGKLYCRPYYNRMNLAEALMYFFNTHQFGVLQCFKKSLAFGYIPGSDGGYFLFDCQSRDQPLFVEGQGASYVLRTKYLQMLLYCMVITLNVPHHNVPFTLHKIDIVLKNDTMEDERQ